MAKWRTSEKPLQMATIVGFIASDSGSDREVVFEQAIHRNTAVSELMSVSSAYNLACIFNGFEAETFIYFL